LSDENTFKKALKPYNVRMIGIVWDIDSRPYHRLLRLCSERIVARGDNHQTLRPDSTVDAEHEAVVSSFLHNFTTPDPTLFDKQIIVSVEDDPRSALDTIVNGLAEALNLPVPTPEAIDAALAEAQGHKTKTPFHGLARVGKTVRYFGLAPEIDINSVIDEALESPMPQASSSSARSFLTQIREKNRVTQKPHITLSHEKNVAAEKEAAREGAADGPHAAAWNTCVALAEARLSPIYEFDVTHVVWDDRVMALVVAGIRPQTPTSDAEADRGVGTPLILPEEVEINLHVTVGTQNEEITAFESRGVVRVAREAMARGASSGEAGEAVEGGGAVHWAPVGPITGTGRIRGMY
jgi:tRNA ligase